MHDFAALASDPTISFRMELVARVCQFRAQMACRLAILVVGSTCKLDSCADTFPGSFNLCFRLGT